MGAVADDAVEERLALDALAHEPALHVGEGDDDRVDPAVADHRLELGEARVLGRVAVVASWSVIGLLVGARGCEGRPAAPAGPRAIGSSGVRQAVATSSAACSNSRSISVSSALSPMDARALEPRSGPAEVVDRAGTGPVADHERPRDVARGRDREQDHQDEDPGDGDPGDRLRPAAEAPDALLEPVLGRRARGRCTMP